jgi:hypothetical protein
MVTNGVPANLPKMLYSALINTPGRILYLYHLNYPHSYGVLDMADTLNLDGITAFEILYSRLLIRQTVSKPGFDLSMGKRKRESDLIKIIDGRWIVLSVVIRVAISRIPYRRSNLEIIGKLGKYSQV